ncbi:MAG: hypothetical protein NTU49_02555 [Gammaproteobacteria bacterium]|nr:hypothetical protein [Gammaproteobacteria bacterium]
MADLFPPANADGGTTNAHGQYTSMEQKSEQEAQATKNATATLKYTPPQ